MPFCPPGLGAVLRRRLGSALTRGLGARPGRPASAPLGLALLALLRGGLLALAGLLGLLGRLLRRLGVGLGLRGVDPGDRLALALQAGVVGLLRGRPGRRHPPDDVELLAHRPHVGGEPVDEDTDREVDTGHREHERQHVEQHLLLLGERVVQRRRRHVLGHQLALGGEGGGRHQDDQHDRDDLGRHVGGLHERRRTARRRRSSPARTARRPAG